MDDYKQSFVKFASRYRYLIQEIMFDDVISTMLAIVFNPRGVKQNIKLYYPYE